MEKTILVELKSSTVCLGRALVPSDNTPAVWVISMCCNENKPSFSQLKQIINSYNIPVAFSLSKKSDSKYYHKKKHKIDDPNKRGWKISHIDPIGLGRSKKIILEDIDIKKLEDHFEKFLNPRNMFLFSPKNMEVWLRSVRLLKYSDRKLLLPSDFDGRTAPLLGWKRCQ